MTIITLLSDFGLVDPYVAEMKGVMLSICPNVNLVDISHEVDKFDINMGMFVLASAAPHFPRETIHVAVIDPGVGGTRRSILVKAKNHHYVGPDNGILMLAAGNEGIDQVYHITNKHLVSKFVSATFHGRDIFAYIASHIANGLEPQKVGIEIHDYLVPEFTEAKVTDDEIDCEIIHADGFGNLVTNIHSKDLERSDLRFGSNLTIKIGKSTFNTKLHRTYSEAPEKGLMALVGSHDFLEIAMNQGSAEEKLKITRGGKLKLAILD